MFLRNVCTHLPCRRRRVKTDSHKSILHRHEDPKFQQPIRVCHQHGVICSSAPFPPFPSAVCLQTECWRWQWKGINLNFYLSCNIFGTQTWTRSLDSSVSTMGHGLDDRGSIPCRNKGIFSSLQPPDPPTRWVSGPLSRGQSGWNSPLTSV
jgi:hypothetical protein